LLLTFDTIERVDGMNFEGGGSGRVSVLVYPGNVSACFRLRFQAIDATRYDAQLRA